MNPRQVAVLLLVLAVSAAAVWLAWTTRERREELAVGRASVVLDGPGRGSPPTAVPRDADSQARSMLAAAITTTEAWVSVDAPGGGVAFHQMGVTVEADTSVRLVVRLRTHDGVETPNVRTMNGHPFGVRDGVFFLGEHDFGPTPSGSTVRVTAGGVFVDGERRGDLPAPADLIDAPGMGELR
jgi:hypothetical protein